MGKGGGEAADMRHRRERLETARVPERLSRDVAFTTSNVLKIASARNGEVITTDLSRLT
jgi:hypothetical protein